MQSVIQSTCCSIEMIMLESTDGLCGPVTMNRFGKSLAMRPRYVWGPASHAFFSVLPFLPSMSTLTMAPVIASKPVANTMASNSNDSSWVSMPVSVIVLSEFLRMLTRRTCSRL
ncbi:unannotated protein [freshwater metagenome]|uniref:Unannotated protein n=1 Tax=freshwater metagenome TaxID=449393 RepID=A0A6J6RPM6_9ZZZZ